MRKLTAVLFLLALDVTAQTMPRKVGPVPKPAAVKPPRLIAMPGVELLVLDLGGNGIDLSGQVRTSLVTGSPATVRWTKAQTDDAIVVVDATALRSRGLSLLTAAGVALEGSVFPRGGLKLTDPAGSSFTAAHGLDVLARLDGNRDGRIDKSDPAWSSISLFRDRDADGAIGAGELTAADEMLRSVNVAASGSESIDEFGSRRVPGTAQLLDGTAVAMTHASVARIDAKE